MAILSRFTKAFPANSFRRYVVYALGEVLLIFTGITLSLWFSNWNESQKEKDIEAKILYEIRTGLVHDSLDVTGNVALREDAKQACIKILQIVENNSSYNDSVNIYFAKAYQFASTEVKTSSYQTLKSRGLNTITNDALRTKVIELYDIYYSRIHAAEERHSDLFFNFLVPLNATRFNVTNPYGEMQVVNYDQLSEDREYRYYINMLIFYNDFQIINSRIILKRIRELIAAIDQELDEGVVSTIPEQ